MEQVQQAPEQQPAQGQPDPKALAIFQRLGMAAMKIVYDKAVSQQLVQIMGAAEDPATGLAEAANTVLEQMKQQVQGIDPNAVYSVAAAVVAFCAELGEAAAIFKPDQAMLAEALNILGQKAGGAQEGPAATPATETPHVAQAPRGLIDSAMAS